MYNFYTSRIKYCPIMFNVRLRFTSYKMRPVDLIEGPRINDLCLHTLYEEFNITATSAFWVTEMFLGPPFRRKIRFFFL